MNIGNMKHMNSIEDIEGDMKILEGIDIKYFLSGSVEQNNYIVSTANEVNKAIEHILSDYKRVLKENENLSHENRKLRTIRYDTAYGVESIYLITKRDLVEINTNKYFIEIQDGKFVDLKQVYQENEKLNEYKENYIPVEKVKDKIEELKKKVEELTDEKGYWGGSDLLEQIKVLQVLLEKEK